MGYPCRGFEMEDAQAAHDHITANSEVVEKYGDTCDGHLLHVWDDGWRALLKCRECGGYVLEQYSEYHSFSTGDDDSYRNYFPVSGPEEAEELNKRFDGSDIESQFDGRYLTQDNDNPPCWHH